MIWPSDIGIASVKIGSINPAFVSESQNMRRYVNIIPGHRWEITFSTIPLLINEQRKFWAWVNALQGQAGEFDAVLPIYSTPQGEGIGFPLSAGGVIGEKTVNVTNLAPNIFNWLMAGDYVRFDSHNKVYQVTQDVVTDSSGSAVLTLNTNLQQGVAAGENIIIQNVPFRLGLRNEIQEFTVDPEKYVVFEVDCVEILQ